MKRFTLTSAIIAVVLALFVLSCDKNETDNSTPSNGSGGNNGGVQTCFCTYYGDVMDGAQETFPANDPPAYWGNNNNFSTCSAYQQSYNSYFAPASVSCSVVN
jgi:hypothetical protein